MTRGMIEQLSTSTLQRAKEAYWELCFIYEDLCGGVDGAYKYREYLVICDNINAINKELYGRQQAELSREKTEGGSY